MSQHPQLAQTIEQKLHAKLSVTFLNVINESHLHAGHAGDNGTGESHFRLHIEADELEGKTRIEQHRCINQILADELAGPIHALAIHIGKPL